MISKSSNLLIACIFREADQSLSSFLSNSPSSIPENLSLLSGSRVVWLFICLPIYWLGHGCNSESLQITQISSLWNSHVLSCKTPKHVLCFSAASSLHWAQNAATQQHWGILEKGEKNKEGWGRNLSYYTLSYLISNDSLTFPKCPFFHFYLEPKPHFRCHAIHHLIEELDHH